MSAFVKGCNGWLVSPDDFKFSENIPTPPCAIWGLLRGNNVVIDWCKEHDIDYYYLDNKYFGQGYVRVTKNAHQTVNIKKRSGDRYAQLKLNIEPWRTTGRNIIISPPSQGMAMYFGITNWLEETMATLRQHTDRPIIVREKPVQKIHYFDSRGYLCPHEYNVKEIHYAVPLETLMEDAYAVVTFNSNIALEAVRRGIPVFVDSTSAAAPMGQIDFRKIEEPVYPDRFDWFNHIAYSQFTLEELESGYVWKILNEGD